MRRRRWRGEETNEDPAGEILDEKGKKYLGSVVCRVTQVLDGSQKQEGEGGRRRLKLWRRRPGY